MTRFWMRNTASMLAIVGGASFLVIPVGFYMGMISVAYPLPSFRCPPGSLCPIFWIRQLPPGTVPFWASLGIIGILLGFLTLKLGSKPRVGIAMGVAFSLGSNALLFSTVTAQIRAVFIITPASFLLFPEVSIVAMIGATVLFSYEFLHRGREIITAITS